jgi:hypothetical protein
MKTLEQKRCEKYLMVTLGMGWKPSSEAGRAGDPVQK